MLRHPDYTRARLAQLGDRLHGRIYPETRRVDELRVSPRVDRITWAKAQELAYRPATLGEQFGPLWATYWFRVRTSVPTEWRDARVDLLWVSHSEATLWRDGRILQGLNHHPLTRTDMGARDDATVLRNARGGEELELQIEMACNRMFGAPDRIPFESVSPFVLDRCDIARFDPRAWQLHHDFAVLRELEAADGVDPSWRGELLAELNAFANVVVPEEPATWTAGEEILAKLYTRTNAARVHAVSAVGHAHIDTAWLWPIAETMRKCERTFSTQVAYMDDYPEYVFACSQAQQYTWIKVRQPELFERIRAKVATQQFVPVGGMWVEPDCNIPSGESLVRQFLFGQRFFQREFGVMCREMWLPDVFGYNGQLPQIAKLCGVEYFLTQKLSWNRFTKPEHHTFSWQGIDGSEILTHFPPTDTYSSQADVADLLKGAREYKDHDRSRASLLLFGHGDGGGGATRRMLEVLRRARDLQGLPRTTIERPDQFFERLASEVTDRPTVVGELYFEYHRGTYTTQARIKRDNRNGEVLLHDAELLAALAHRTAGYAYPTAELAEAWVRVLTDQFHDILPGSSIAEVYDDARRTQAQAQDRARHVRNEAMRVLAGGGARELPFNTLGIARAEVAERSDGSACWIEAPPCGIGRVGESSERVTLRRDGAQIVMENGTLRAVLIDDGSLASLSVRGREALAGPGNVLELYDDRPTAFDAWDIDPFHLETRRVCAPAERCEIVEDGPLRVRVVFERSIGKRSRMRQTVSLAAGGRFLEFHTHVDWHEEHALLKVAFPVSVRAMRATYEMQFGVVERPTHFNAKQDLAMFEVPGHRFADLSEHGFGVALLTRDKYGYSTHGNVMRISLLRAPTSPDPGADRGEHEFSYAIYPHVGSWQEARVTAEAHRFATPIVWTHGSREPVSFASCGDDNLVISAIKRAEDSDDTIVRLYEAHGARGTARLVLGFEVERAVMCDLLERDIETLRIEGNAIVLPYRPFQIISIKVS
jgi:alpha-mannosidase